MSKKKFKFNKELFGKSRFEALTTNVRLINENDTATRQEEVAEGHTRYQEHIRRTRERLGLVDNCVCGNNYRNGE